MIDTLIRCIRLRCPACGRLPVFVAPFKRRRSCPSCGAQFDREEGYFVGAIMINVVGTEVALLAAYLICLSTVGFGERLILTFFLPMGLILPVAFYHHSWSVWLSLNHWIDSLSNDESC
jgi:uncharacterized protein (DUF983 family)